MACESCTRGDKLETLDCPCGGKIIANGEIITTYPSRYKLSCDKCRLTYHVLEPYYLAMKGVEDGTCATASHVKAC